MLQNVIAGLQGVVDHVLVGNLIGYAAQRRHRRQLADLPRRHRLHGVAVHRAGGAGGALRRRRRCRQGQPHRAAGAADRDRDVRGDGRRSATSPRRRCSTLVNASPEVRALALPFLRINFAFSIGMLLFFMLTSALRAAGDARTPLRLGVTMTMLNVVLNVILIRGLGPIPALGTAGSALGTVIASSTVSAYALYQLFKGRLVIKFSRHMDWRPDWTIIRSLFRFGLPTGVQGIAMNVAGVMLLRFIGSLEQSAAAQAAYAIGYTELFSLITWTSVGLMGAAATIAGQNLGAGQPERAMQGVHTASRIGLAVAAGVGLDVRGVSASAAWRCSAPPTPAVATIGEQLLQYLAVSGFFITLALTYTGGLQGTGDTRSPLFITLASQIAVPIGMCTDHPGDAAAAARRHLAGDRAGSLHALRPHRRSASARASGARSPSLTDRHQASGRSGQSGVSRQASCRSGIVSVNVAPSPSRDDTRMPPPCFSASARAIVRPRPVPAMRRVSLPSSCVNGSKMKSTLCAGMPGP